MASHNDSTSSSKGLGKKNPPDEAKWHPGRQLCYTWKKEHTFLAEQVEHNNIIYNTQFDLGIEHCTMERKPECMSLRPSVKGEPCVLWQQMHAAAVTAYGHVLHLFFRSERC